VLSVGESAPGRVASIADRSVHYAVAILGDARAAPGAASDTDLTHQDGKRGELAVNGGY